MDELDRERLYIEYIVNGKSRGQISKEYGLTYATVSSRLQTYNIRRNKAPEKHGLCKHPLNIVWCGMKERCNNPNSDNYKWYGGRGIRVCEEWNNNFYSFYTWAINNGWKKGLELDRQDNMKDYCPENCKWITHKQQCRNRRSNVRIEINGISLLMCEWEERFNLRKKSLTKMKYRHGEEYMIKHIKGLLENEGKSD